MDRKIIIKTLEKYFIKSIAELIEESIYLFAQKYAEENEAEFLKDQIYKSKADQILCILTGKSSKYLVEQITKKNIDPGNIAFLKEEKLDPYKYKKILDEKKKKNLKKEIGTDVYQCKKCKKKRCRVQEKQIRAGDEPATLFITCLECGHTFSLAN